MQEDYAVFLWKCEYVIIDKEGKMGFFVVVGPQ